MNFFQRLHAAGGPPRSRRETTILMVAGIVFGFASSAAFFLHFLGWISMPFFVNFFGLPLIMLILTLGLYSWQRRLPFWIRLRAGLLAGFFGLIVYDTIRFTLYKTQIVPYFPFHAIPRLGALITSRPPTDPSSLYWGWGYHFWNGFSFAIIYALIAGPAAWGWGIAWAMILETLMLLSYPTLLGVKADAPFLIISIVGHICYGSVLGLTVRRFARGTPAWTVPA